MLEGFKYFQRNRGEAHETFVAPLHVFHRDDLGVAFSGFGGELVIEDLDLHFFPSVHGVRRGDHNTLR